MVEFSIIVPIYKVEPYLRQCIDSILNQTYTDFELILVDDGSPDNCGRICDEYAEKDKRVNVIHKLNGGLVSARKAGSAKSTGKYIMNVDGDDYIGSGLLQEIHGVITLNFPDMVAFGCKKIRNDGSIICEIQNKLPLEKLYFTCESDFYDTLIYDRDIWNFNSGSIYPSVCSKAVKREKLLDCQMAVPDEISIGEDAAVCYSTLCRCNSVYLSKTCEYYYRYNDSSMVNTFKQDMLRGRQLLFKFMENNMDKIPQENKDAYACHQIILHISGAVPDFNCYNDFSRYIYAEMTPELHKIIDRCQIPHLPLKQKILFILLKKYCFWGFWLIYRRNLRLKKR